MGGTPRGATAAGAEGHEAGGERGTEAGVADQLRPLERTGDPVLPVAGPRRGGRRDARGPHRHVRREMTMDALETIMTTRAIRRFTDQPVSDEDLATCLRAAQQAPSGGNVQPQQYVVVTDPEVRAGIGVIYQQAYHRYEAALPEATDFDTPEK